MKNCCYDTYEIKLKIISKKKVKKTDKYETLIKFFPKNHVFTITIENPKKFIKLMNKDIKTSYFPLFSYGFLNFKNSLPFDYTNILLEEIKPIFVTKLEEITKENEIYDISSIILSKLGIKLDKWGKNISSDLVNDIKEIFPCSNSFFLICIEIVEYIFIH